MRSTLFPGFFCFILDAVSALIVRFQLGKKKYAVYKNSEQGKEQTLEIINFAVLLLSIIEFVTLLFIFGPEHFGVISGVVAGLLIAVFVILGVLSRRFLRRLFPDDYLTKKILDTSQFDPMTIRIGNVAFSRYVEKADDAERFRQFFPGGLSQAAEAAKNVAAKLGSGDLSKLSETQIHKSFEIYEAVYFKDQRSLEALVPDKELAEEIKAYCQKEQSKAPSDGESTGD